MSKKKTKDNPVNSLPGWDLSVAFYSSLEDTQIGADLKQLKSISKELALYRGEIEELEPFELSIMLAKYETVIALSRKLHYFAHMYSDTHKTDEAASRFKSSIGEEISNATEHLSFVHFELNGLPFYKKEEFINHPKLYRWMPWLKSLFQGYWSLNETAAFIINKKSLVSSSWDRLYDETCAKLKFHLKGKTFNEAEIGEKVGDKSAQVRQAATAEMNRVYKENAHIIAMCYNMILKDKSVDDELYSMSEPVSSSLYSNGISKKDLMTMVNAVADSYIPIPNRFYKLMAKMMKVDCISYADRNYNPVEIKEKKVTWQECAQSVIDAYAEFSYEYAARAAVIINSGIIDVPPREGKTSGAYCMRGEYPYMLLNFSGNANYARTVAHECGHAVHHTLSAKVGVLNDTTPTALAEVASEFAEYLLFKQQMVKAETNREKLALLIDRVQDMINSIHRQVAFYKFEEFTHRERKKGELSTERLNQIWREQTSRYFGFDIGKEVDHMWMGISHIFNMPYYVYSYAFAGLVVNNLIKAYENWDENHEGQLQESFEDLYLNMLSCTGIEDYKSLLEPFDIDADDPEFWHKGLSLITEYIDEIEKLAKAEGLL